MKKPLLSIFFLLNILGVSIKSDNISFIPKIINYSASEYKGGNQNWSISQTDDRKIIIGNNQGLLQYDGTNWRLQELSNHSPLRAVIEVGERIYIGSFEEFGYFEKDRFNELKYYSLSQLMTYPVDVNEEFWTIIPFGDVIIFQSFSGFYIYDGHKVEKGDTPKAPLFIYKIKDELYCQFIEGGLGKFNGKTFVEIITRKSLCDDNVTSALSFNDDILLLTAGSGVFLLNSESQKLTKSYSFINEELNNLIINRAIYSKDSLLIIGTINDGIYAFNDKELVWHLNKSNGLINNTILSLYEDTFGNLWAGTDNGVSLICKNSPISVYKPKYQSLGMVYDLYHELDNYYLCTNQGLYMTKSAEEPRLVQGTQEQCWYLSKIDQQLFLGHNKGLMEFSSSESKLISGPYSGGLAMRRCKIHGKDVLIQLSYSSLSVFEKNDNGRWVFSHVIEGFNKRLKSFEVSHDGTIWAAHQYHGVYRIRLDESLKNIKEVRYLKSLTSSVNASSVNVMLLRGRVIFSSGNTFYTYDDVNDKVIGYDDLNNQLFGFADTYRIVNISDDLFWFIRNNSYSVIGYEYGQFESMSNLPFSFFSNPPIEGQANVFVEDRNLSYISLDGGIARYDFHFKDIYDHQSDLSLSSVHCENKSNDGIRLLETNPYSVPSNLDPEENTIRFTLSFPCFGLSKYKIMAKLSGYDSQWCVVSDNYVLTYNNLTYGDYILDVKVIDDSEKEISTLSYPFHISNHWYLMPVMIVFYIAMFCFLVYGLSRVYIKSKLNKQQKEVEIQNQRNELILKQKEQMIIKLENEKLEEQLNYKNRELTNTVLALKNSDDFLLTLKDDFQNQLKSDHPLKPYLKIKIREINDRLSNNEDWTLYMKNFDGLNEQFFLKLKSKYPDLTPGDLRMCAFLRMNMPTKDIARFQNVSIRGVEASRYRLRKKLGIDETVNLVDFILSQNLSE